MNYETNDMNIMINYLHRRKKIECELVPREDCFDENGVDWSEPGDDPMMYRGDYDRDLAEFLDEYEDGMDLTKKEGFHDLFIRGKVPQAADDAGFRRFDALFRNSQLAFSVFPDGKTRLGINNYHGRFFSDATEMRVLAAIYAREDPIHGPHLYLRIKGGVWNRIGRTKDEKEDRKEEIREREWAEHEALGTPVDYNEEER